MPERIIITSPHGDHLDVPDATLPHFLLHLGSDSEQHRERLTKPIFYPSPTSERKPGSSGAGAASAAAAAATDLVGKVKDTLGLSPSNRHDDAPSGSGAGPDYDTAGPLSLLQIRDIAARVAVSLLSWPSWKPGSVVAFFSTNQHDYCGVVLGVQLAGGTAALCNPAYKARELSHQLRMTKATLLVVSGESYDTACKAAEHAAAPDANDGTTGDDDDDLEPLPRAPHVLVFSETHQYSYVDALLRPDPAAWAEREAKVAAAQKQISPAQDPAVICFSSGTSGLPKALALTHRNLIANVLQFWTLMIDEFEPPISTAGPPSNVSEMEVKRHAAGHDLPHFHIDFLPCFHAYGLQCQFVALYSATPRLVLQRFKLDVFLQAIQEHKATFAFVVPPILLALAKTPEVDKYDLSSMKHVASGAATLSQELARQVKERLGIVTTDGFGLSEMSPIVCLQNVQDALESPDSVGFLAPGTRARIVGENGNDLPAGEEGELYLQGPQMMAGYLHNEEGNRAAFTTEDRADPDCWLRSGDLAKAMPEGRICITGRTKDIIKCKGFQVSPKELEDLLFKRPAVADVAIVGAKDDDGNEVPWAFIVASPQAQAQPEEERTNALLTEVNALVAGYKRIRGVTWLSELPKSASGKILKRELKV